MSRAWHVRSATRVLGVIRTIVIIVIGSSVPQRCLMVRIGGGAWQHFRTPLKSLGGESVFLAKIQVILTVRYI